MFVISISRDPVRETKNYLKRIIILKYPVSRDIFTRNSTRSTLWETGNPGDSGTKFPTDLNSSYSSPFSPSLVLKVLPDTTCECKPIN